MELAEVHLHLRESQALSGRRLSYQRAAGVLGQSDGQADGGGPGARQGRDPGDAPSVQRFCWRQALPVAGRSRLSEEASFPENCYITSITKCFPGPNASGHGDRAPNASRAAPVHLLAGSGGGARQSGSDRARRRPGCGSLSGCGSQTRRGGRRPFPGGQPALIPLPHPSGASGSTQKPEHRLLMQQAIAHLAAGKSRVERAMTNDDGSRRR